MGRNNAYLTLDLGAGNGRAFLCTIENGRISAEELHRFGNKPVRLGGTVYWDFLYLWGQVLEALRRCAAEGYDRLKGIGIDTWNADFGLIGKGGMLLANPVSYRDQATLTVLDEIGRLIEENELFHITGSGLNPITALSRLFHIRKELLPDVFRITETYLPLPDLFRFYLTGERKAEETILWGSQLISIESRSWASEIIEAARFPRKIFPEIIPPGTVAGKLTEEVCGATGMKPSQVIAVAGHDTISASAAVTDRRDTTMFISTGTWSVAGNILGRAVEDYRAAHLGFFNALGVESVVFAKFFMGFYILEGCIDVWTLRGIDCSYEALNARAERSTPFALRIDPNDPALFSSAQMEKTLGQYLAATGQEYPDDPGIVVRSLFEGLVFSYRETAEQIETLTGKRIRQVHVLGGGVKNPVFCRMIADGAGRPVTLGAAEATVLGNLGMQASATGEVEGLDAFHQILRESFPQEVLIPGDPGPWEEEYRKRQREQR